MRVLHFDQARELGADIPTGPTGNDTVTGSTDVRSRAPLAATLFAHVRRGLGKTMPLDELDSLDGANAAKTLSELGEPEAAEVIRSLHAEPAGVVHSVYDRASRLLRASGWHRGTRR